MTQYQNAGQSSNQSKFISVDANGAVTDAIFGAKVTQVPVAGGRKVPVVTDSLSLVRQKGVSCPEDTCSSASVGNNVKITLTCVRGDTAALTALLDEAIRLVGLWRSTHHADIGVLPNPTATFPTE